MIIKPKHKEGLRIILIVFAGICVNFLGKQISAALQLPLWLDAFGTTFVAYVLGPWCGAIVGAAGNICYAFWSPSSFFYSIVSIFIGISIGYAARAGYFQSIFGAMSVSGTVTIGSVVISTILNLIFFEGRIGNLWGDGVMDYLLEKGARRILACAIGELYIDFLDKVVTVICMYFLIRFIRSDKEKRKNVQKAGGVLILAVFLSLMSKTEACATALIDQSSYIRNIYNADNQLPCGHANDIVQTNDGVLWVGSYAGLYRYNGSSFQFMSDFEDVKNVNCMYVDEEGRLWIGTNDNGIVMAIAGKVANTFNSEGGLCSDSIRCIIQGPDGSYYVGTSSGMAILKLRNGISVASIIDELGYTTSITSDSGENVACVTAEGRMYILREEKIAFEIPMIDGNCLYSSCVFDQEGILHAGTTDGRIISFRVNEKSANREKVTHCPGITEINKLYPEEDRLICSSDPEFPDSLREEPRAVFGRYYVTVHPGEEDSEAPDRFDITDADGNCVLSKVSPGGNRFLDGLWGAAYVAKQTGPEEWTVFNRDLKACGTIPSAEIPYVGDTAYIEGFSYEELGGGTCDGTVTYLGQEVPYTRTEDGIGVLYEGALIPVTVTENLYPEQINDRWILVRDGKTKIYDRKTGELLLETDAGVSMQKDSILLHRDFSGEKNNENVIYDENMQIAYHTERWMVPCGPEAYYMERGPYIGIADKYGNWLLRVLPEAE